MTYKEQLSSSRISTDQSISYAFSFLTDKKGSVEIKDNIKNDLYYANFFIVPEVDIWDNKDQ